MVHILVLETFVCPRPPGMEARHLDGDPANNALSNLQWGTRQENLDDMNRHGTMRHGSQKPMAKLTEDVAREILDLYLQGMSLIDLSAKYSYVTKAAVRQVIKGIRWKRVYRQWREDNRLGNLQWGVPPPGAYDAARLGRGTAGEGNGNAKITQEDVYAIRQLLADGVTHKSIASQYGVTESTISAIARRVTWAYLP